MNIESILSWGVSIGLILYTVYVLIKFYKELNSKDFDAFQEHDEPSRIASLGVLGTFIGITIGLLGFDENNIDTSVPILLSGMQTAFITSITGMIGSILMKYWQHNKQKEELSHQSSDSIDENATIATLIKYLQEKDIEQAKFNNQLLDSINLMNKSTSGIAFISSFLYLSTKHPVTIKYLQLCFLYSAISNIVLIASSFAEFIKPHVFITIISALSGSFTIS